MNSATRRRLAPLHDPAFNQNSTGAHVVLHHERPNIDLRALNPHRSHLGAGGRRLKDTRYQ
jgi:hypothetical protein